MNHRARFVTVVLLALGAAAATPSLAAQSKEAPVSRPAGLGVQANIVFLYYKDIPAAQRFYEDVLGLTLTVDQGFAKIYQVSPTSFIGLVDETQGLHRAAAAKPVTVSFVTEQVDAWYSYLQSRGVRLRGELRDATRHPTRGFVALDPEGYFLEFETFLEHEQNARIRAALAPKEQP
jgi:catechol 2,3-dioxygenase-like lactoylglutathione lyase family enzyme